MSKVDEKLDDCICSIKNVSGKYYCICDDCKSEFVDTIRILEALKSANRKKWLWTNLTIYSEPTPYKVDNAMDKMILGDGK